MSIILFFWNFKNCIEGTKDALGILHLEAFHSSRLPLSFLFGSTRALFGVSALNSKAKRGHFLCYESCLVNFHKWRTLAYYLADELRVSCHAGWRGPILALNWKVGDTKCFIFFTFQNLIHDGWESSIQWEMLPDFIAILVNVRTCSKVFSRLNGQFKF